MDILNKIDSYLNENAIQKHAKAQALGLKNISFNNYEDANGDPWFWSIVTKDFKKSTDAKRKDYAEFDKKCERKPVDWHHRSSNAIKLSELKGLETFEDEEVYGSGVGEYPVDDFKKNFKPPQRFILRKDGELFYVNTEGANYARYVAPIVND